MIMHKQKRVSHKLTFMFIKVSKSLLRKNCIFACPAGESASADRPEGGLSQRVLSLEGVPPPARSAVKKRKSLLLPKKSRSTDLLNFFW